MYTTHPLAPASSQMHTWDSKALGRVSFTPEVVANGNGVKLSDFGQVWGWLGLNPRHIGDFPFALARGTLRLRNLTILRGTIRPLFLPCPLGKRCHERLVRSRP